MDSPRKSTAPLENPLEFIYKILIKPLRYKLFKIALLSVALILSFGQSIFILEFVRGNIDAASFIQAAPIFCSYFTYITAAIFLLAYANNLEKYHAMIEKCCLHLGSAGEKIETKILHECKLIRIFFAITFFNYCSSAFVFLPRNENIEKLFIVIGWLKKNAGSWSFTLICCYFATFPFMIYFALSAMFLFIYFTRHGIFQLYILKEHIGNIQRSPHHLQDETQQKKFRDQLIFCYKIYQNVHESKLLDYNYVSVAKMKSSRKSVASLENPLEFINKILIKPLRYRLFKISLVYVILILSFGQLIFILEFARGNIDSTSFIQAAPIFCAYFTYITAAIFLLAYAVDLAKYHAMIEKYCLHLGSAGSNIQNKILRECKWIRFFFVIVFLNSCATALTFLPRNENIEKLYTVVGWFKQNAGSWSFTLICCYFATFPFMVYFALYTTFLFIYFTRHGIFQLYILKEHINNIQGSPHHLHDKTQQKIIQDQLVFCYKIYQNVHEFISYGTKLLYYPITLCRIPGVAMGASIIFFTRSQWGNVEMYPLILTVSLGLTGLLAVILVSAQAVINNSSLVFDLLYELPWYYWNNSNKKILIIMLMRTLEPIEYTSTDDLILNYSLAVDALRSVFSLTTVLYRFRDMQ